MRKILFLIILILCGKCAQAQSPWPGQSGNAVGYAAAPGWPGSFNTTACPAQSSGSSWATAVVISNCTYNPAPTVTCSYCEFLYVDFNGGTGTNNISGNNIIFFGDRFQSNRSAASNISALGSYLYFMYDSVVPLVSLVASPPGAAWPSAGAGSNSTTQTNGVNSTLGTNGYQYGITAENGSGPTLVDHCDIWGFGNVAFQSVQTTTAQMTITNNWFHDARYAGTNGDHTDGIGFLNGATGPNNWLVVGNTIATLGTDDDLALQAATGGYQNIYINDNYWSGDGSVTIDYCQPGSVRCTNSTFYGNVFGTDLLSGGAVYSPGSALGSGAVWACNTINFTSGTTWTTGDGWTPTSGMNGEYFLNALPPNSTTDLGGNTLCGLPTPSSINFGNQGTNTTSAGQTITFSSTNTGNLSISSIALATGTQFSISSKTCGSTLNSGSSCSITVQFSPTSMGPQTDTLRITDNTPGVSSPQLVPLAGIGIGSTASNGDPAPPTGLTALVQ